ncbi:hypothetical protein RKE30_05555 [Streptomyces sp. Li-HN-5-11]|uniref:hypothetical protein n=1 Tax=Streptomyces sp. Li-HN-5-11 TaxID=3075432 RepID=UPI0028A7F7E6|nr:hypothetical protein [Streptomyces sp. Li-HN-5-11]WNM29899.1 hypothetical protein RKE30_05555 [Streptomyces sp. Li-HN-5-11]
MSRPQYPQPQPQQQPQPPQQPYRTGPDLAYSSNQPAGTPPPQPPQPPKKRGIGKILGFGCLGVVGLFVVIAVIAAAAGGGSGKSGSSGAAGDSKSAAASKGTESTGDDKSGTSGGKAQSDDSRSSSDIAVFKVWGTAPAGALGSLDITYGSDSDTRKGNFENGGFEATLPVTKGAMYEQVTAQLQGSGDIHCSITVGGKTRTGHASGGYNICSAQLSGGLFGGWE